MLGVYAATAFRLLPSANRILVNINAFRYGLPVVKVIKNELSIVKSYLENKNNVEVKNIFFKDIKFNNVDFKYDGSEKKIFDGLSLNI